MSNERIDLTQFEKITQGKWELIDTPIGGIVIGVRDGTKAYRPVITFTERMGKEVRKIERDVADMNAIASVPEFIAELKRCYKQIDLLTKAFMMAGNAGCYMTICEECDTVHLYDEHCPFICEYCGEISCECPTSEEE